MLGDETQPAWEEEPRGKASSGPRHAAPRKSLLTKLHVPAGKAVALAAMPTAVLMGMGLTPHLAQADEQPSNPFKAGPCVTQSETPSATPSATDGGSADKGAKGAKGAKDSGGATGAKDGKGAKDTATPTTSPTAGSSGSTAGKTGEGEGKTPDPTVSPTAPATTQPRSAATTAPSSAQATDSASNPLDPLGLGNLLGGLLGGNNSAPKPTPTPTTQAPQPPATTAPPAPDPTTTTQAPAKPSSGATQGSTGSVGTAVKGAADGAADAAGKAVKDLTGGAGTPSPSASPGATAGKGDPASASGTDSDGKQPYPCPTYDAKALADAKVEGGIPLLADQPWTLKSSLLTLYGLNYEGIVQVRTWSGTVKDVMKFTATGIDIGDLQQTVQGPDGTTTTVTGRPGSTSTIRNGTVTLYTESLSGKLFGLVPPITFTPKAPPPLILPVLFFTDATVVQAAQFGGDLHIPGMRVLPDQHA